MGAAALNVGVKGLLFGVAFGTGQEVGNLLGAVGDTLVDHSMESESGPSSFMKTMHDVGFGSEISNRSDTAGSES